MSIRIRLLLLMLFLLILPTIVPLATPAYADECHSSIPCPEPKACSNWSAAFNCGTLYCDYHPICAKTGDLATLQPREKFRSCTLQDGSTCLEYAAAPALRTACGCDF
ncbi:MAG TPA: hypothetical protein VF789_18370 [Thermoanaerobaculia bacterium]